MDGKKGKVVLIQFGYLLTLLNIHLQEWLKTAGRGILPYMWDFYCTFAHMCSTDLTKRRPCIRELDNCLFKSPITPHLLPIWEGGA